MTDNRHFSKYLTTNCTYQQHHSIKKKRHKPYSSQSYFDGVKRNCLQEDERFTKTKNTETFCTTKSLNPIGFSVMFCVVCNPMASVPKKVANVENEIMFRLQHIYKRTTMMLNNTESSIDSPRIIVFPKKKEAVEIIETDIIPFPVSTNSMLQILKWNDRDWIMDGCLHITFVPSEEEHLFLGCEKNCVFFSNKLLLCEERALFLMMANVVAHGVGHVLGLRHRPSNCAHFPSKERKVHIGGGEPGKLSHSDSSFDEDDEDERTTHSLRKEDTPVASLQKNIELQMDSFFKECSATDGWTEDHDALLNVVLDIESKTGKNSASVMKPFANGSFGGRYDFSDSMVMRRTLLVDNIGIWCEIFSPNTDFSHIHSVVLKKEELSDPSATTTISHPIYSSRSTPHSALSSRTGETMVVDTNERKRESTSVLLTSLIIFVVFLVIFTTSFAVYNIKKKKMSLSK